MSAATLTAKGQIVIPARIRERYELKPGTRVEFVDEDGVIKLLIRRRASTVDPAAGFGMVQIKPSEPGKPARRLSAFDAASMAHMGQSKSRS